MIGSTQFLRNGGMLKDRRVLSTDQCSRICRERKIEKHDAIASSLYSAGTCGINPNPQGIDGRHNRTAFGSKRTSGAKNRQVEDDPVELLEQRRQRERYVAVRNQRGGKEQYVEVVNQSSDIHPPDSGRSLQY